MNILPPCLCNKPQQSTWLKHQCSNCLGVLKESHHINCSSQPNLHFPTSDNLSKSLLDYLNTSAKSSHKRSCTDKSQHSFQSFSHDKVKGVLRNPSEPLLIHKANQHSVPVCLYRKRQERLKKEYSYIGHNNSINEIAVVDNKIWSVGRDYKLVSWVLPQIDYSLSKEGLRSCVSSKIGHSRSITSMVSMSSENLLTGSLDKKAKLWRLSEKAILICEYLHEAPVKSLSAMQGLFISGTSDSKLQVFDVSTGRCLIGYNEHLRPVKAIDTHRANTFLTGGEDCSVKLWDTRTTHSISTFSNHFDEVSTIKVIDQYCFLSGSKDQTVKTWDIRTSAVLDTVYTGQEVSAAEIIRDCLVVAGEKLQLWIKGKVMAEAYARAKCLKYCASNKSVIVGSFDSSLSIYKIML